MARDTLCPDQKGPGRRRNRPAPPPITTLFLVFGENFALADRVEAQRYPMVVDDYHDLHPQIADVMPVRKCPRSRDFADAVVVERLERIDQLLPRQLGPGASQALCDDVGVAISHQVEYVWPPLGRVGVALLPCLAKFEHVGMLGIEKHRQKPAAHE